VLSGNWQINLLAVRKPQLLGDVRRWGLLS
jgi:hypothetical protein